MRQKGTVGDGKTQEGTGRWRREWRGGGLTKQVTSENTARKLVTSFIVIIVTVAKSTTK